MGSRSEERRGVQTCALPIYSQQASDRFSRRRHGRHLAIAQTVELPERSGRADSRGRWEVDRRSVVEFRRVLFRSTRNKPLIAFRAGGTGDISQSHKLWSFQNGPDVPTPVTDGKYLYAVDDRGIMWRLDVKTGQRLWGPQRV